MAYPVTSLLKHRQGNPIYSALYTFRQHAIDLVYAIYPDPEASLLVGILLGVQSGIPQSVQEAFRLTGTSHIIVISGFNITIIVGLFNLFFSHILCRRKCATSCAPTRTAGSSSPLMAHRCRWRLRGNKSRNWIEIRFRKYNCQNRYCTSYKLML
jgi:hypothetical protein